MRFALNLETIVLTTVKTLGSVPNGVRFGKSVKLRVGEAVASSGDGRMFVVVVVGLKMGTSKIDYRSPCVWIWELKLKFF